MKAPEVRLPWLQPGDPFPAVDAAWGRASQAPGLLAAGGALDVATLLDAYRQGIFPWYSADQPILWWSPQPRMVLQTADFKLHRSLRKTCAKFALSPACEIRIDSAFGAVVSACASKARDGQAGTWILPEMVQAYTALHAAGHAHSVETWIDGELAGGLYCTALGQAVFGESMFANRTDASKIALCALVALCKAHNVAMIDCQQNTAHLARLGAAEMPRETFCAHVALGAAKPALAWHFAPGYWDQLFAQVH